ncbi:MAG TPA: DUF1569 domain-containing protein [Cyclobacteriaceae bacterium]
MDLPNIFTSDVAAGVIQRIEKLEPTTPANWGKMDVSQMLAHCCVTYEMAYENIHPKPNFFIKLLLKVFAKKAVTGPAPYKKSTPTAPQFIIKGSRDFEKEKNRLIAYINKTQQLGESYFETKESQSFGMLTINEWNNMFYKHLDHHLSQFGV